MSTDRSHLVGTLFAVLSLAPIAPACAGGMPSGQMPLPSSQLPIGPCSDCSVPGMMVGDASSPYCDACYDPNCAPDPQTCGRCLRKLRLRRPPNRRRRLPPCCCVLIVRAVRNNWPGQTQSTPMSMPTNMTMSMPNFGQIPRPSFGGMAPPDQSGPAPMSYSTGAGMPPQMPMAPPVQAGP
jgi:hypothetical protein